MSSTEEPGPARMADSVDLTIYCPIRPYGQTLGLIQTGMRLSVDRKSSVFDLKGRLEEEMLGNPGREGQTLIWRGRRLRDEEIIGALVKDDSLATREAAFERSDTSGSVYAMHLSVIPSAWKNPNPAVNSQSTSLPATPLSGQAQQAKVKALSPAQAAADRLAQLSSNLSGSSPAGQSDSRSVSAPPLPSSGQHQSGSPTSPTAVPGAPLLGNLTTPLLGPMPLGSFPELRGPPSNQPAGPRGGPTTTPWRHFLALFTALSSGQRAEFIGRITMTQSYYGDLIRYQLERQGPHMAPVTAQDVASLLETGRLSSGSSFTTYDDEFPLQEVESRAELLLSACNLLEGLRTVEQHATKEFEANESAQAHLIGGQTASQIVTISGYPFLLYVPPQFAQPYEARVAAFVQLRKYQHVYSKLEMMLNVARTHQAHHYAAPHFAAARGLAGPLAAGQNGAAGRVAPGLGIGVRAGVGAADGNVRGIGAVGMGAQQAEQLAGPGARLAVVINLEELFSLVVQLAFLSVKLGFLIYIFGRHASTTKRTIMAAMAALWVVWEGFAIRRRARASEARRNQNRDQNQNQNQIQANRQAGQQQQPAQQGQDLQQPQIPGQAVIQRRRARQQGADGGAPPQYEEHANVAGLEQALADRAVQRPDRGTRSSSSRIHRPSPSRLSPKYWMQLVARVGMSAENRELGISRSSPPSSVQPPLDPNAAQQLSSERALRNLWICVVLFLGTLVPEIERMRKKALERRAKKLAQLEEHRNRLAAERRAQTTLAEMSALRQQQSGGMGNGQPNGVQQEEGTSANMTGQHSSSSEGGMEGHQPAMRRRVDPSAAAAAAGGALALPSHLAPRPDGQAGTDSGNLTPSTPAELGIDTSDDAIDVDRELFDPPFDDAQLAAALADAPRPSASASASAAGASGTSGAAHDGGSSQLTHGGTGTASGTTSAYQEDQEGQLDNHGERARPAGNLHLQIPGLGDGLGGDEPTPLLSPADTDDENDGDRREDGVDDEVGMILF